LERTSNTTWTASSNQTWCTIQNPSGSNSATLNVSFTENKTETTRTATITISGTNVSPQTVTVTQTGTTLYTSLVAYYPFNGNANDESGNGNNGTVNGATLTTDRNGNSNKAYSFSGNQQYISTPINSEFTNQITISVWIKTNVNKDNSGVFCSRNGSNGNGIWIFLDGRPYMMLSNGQGVGVSVEASSTVTNNSWHHILATFNGSVAKIYIDGTFINQSTSVYTIILQANFIIGYDALLGYNRYFKGLIDDIRIYNRTLSDTEIQQLYNE